MDEQVKTGGTATEPRERPGRPTAFEAMASKARSGEYRQRRRGWIREHASDDGFLIFVGVVVVAATLGFVGYKLITELRGGPPPEPVPLVAVFNAPVVKEEPPGTITASYDFAMQSADPDLRESCPQMADWLVPGGTISRVEGEGPAANSGVLVNGRFGRYIPYFVPGDLSVECDAALIQGTQIALRLCSIDEGRLNDDYRFEIYASPQEGGPAGAAIVEYRNSQEVRRSDPAQIPEVRARRNPPLFYRLKFELAAGELRGSFEGRVVCRRPVGDLLPGGVMLLGPDSRTAFDNVTIVGRPHPDFVKPRAEMYRLFHGPDQASTSGREAANSNAEPAANKGDAGPDKAGE